MAKEKKYEKKHFCVDLNTNESYAFPPTKEGETQLYLKMEDILLRSERKNPKLGVKWFLNKDYNVNKKKE